MSQALICCPHCGYSKQTAKAKIPATAKQVKCPRCKQSFSLTDAVKPLEEATPSTPPDGGVVGDRAAQTDSTSSEPTAPSPEVTSAPATRKQSAPRPVNFVFSGTGKEYFGIWIVNTLLKIVTLSLYTPWARVRKRRYFYGCTRLDGVNFDYLADPIALLKGWILASVLFLLYFFGSNFSPILSSAIGLIIYILIPWAIVRSRRFNNRYSEHRNIRFNFFPDYKGAYFAYFWLPLLVPLTLGLATPYMIYRQKQFFVENSSFGKTNFKFFASSKDYYMLCLRGLGILILIGVLSSLLAGMLGPFLQGLGQGYQGGVPWIAFAIPVIFVVCYLFVGLYFYVRVTNLTWDNTRLGKHRFQSSIKLGEMFWIFFSNGVAVMLSFGLLMPWAAVRFTRYRLENLTLIVDGSLEEFEAFNRPDENAIGEEIGEIFDMDIGF